MDPSEFAVLSLQLANGDLHRPQLGRVSSEECRVRTAYGRAYYALFLAIRAEIARRHGVPTRRMPHGALYTHLQHTAAGPSVRRLGRELERLYALRQKADYDLAPEASWVGTLQDRQYAELLTKQALDRMSGMSELDFSPIVHRF
jgi:uncharacterized protein (UPF0332 family)